MGGMVLHGGNIADVPGKARTPGGHPGGLTSMLLSSQGGRPSSPSTITMSRLERRVDEPDHNGSLDARRAAIEKKKKEKIRT